MILNNNKNININQGQQLQSATHQAMEKSRSRMHSFKIQAAVSLPTYSMMPLANNNKTVTTSSNSTKELAVATGGQIMSCGGVAQSNDHLLHDLADQEMVDADGPATIIPVPIALAQEPAPVDLDMLVTHTHHSGQTRAGANRLTIQKSVQSKDNNHVVAAIGHKKSADFAMKKQRRSCTSEVKNSFVSSAQIEGGIIQHHQHRHSQQHILLNSAATIKKQNQAIRNCIQTPFDLEPSASVEEATVLKHHEMIATENKNLKQQIAQLQNVIVSMCVLNQRQQSVRTTSSTSKKGSKKSSHQSSHCSGKARTAKQSRRSLSASDNATNSNSLNGSHHLMREHHHHHHPHQKDHHHLMLVNANQRSTGTLHQRRNTTGAPIASQTTKVEIISQSIQKQIEPHPESLMIEPIERPALLSTIPPDWLAVEQQVPPKFRHTTTLSSSPGDGCGESSDFQDEEDVASSSDSNGGKQPFIRDQQQLQKHTYASQPLQSWHRRRNSHQGIFGASQSTNQKTDHFLSESCLKNAGGIGGAYSLIDYDENHGVSMPQYCRTNKAATLQQLLFSVNNTVENGGVCTGGNEDETVDHLLNDADIEVRPDKIPHHPQQTHTRQENTTSSSNARSAKPSVGHRSRRNQMPNFMKKTVSSQAKQVQKSTMSSASSTSTNSVRYHQGGQLSNYATRYTSSRRRDPSKSTASKPRGSCAGDHHHQQLDSRSELQYMSCYPSSHHHVGVLSDDSNAEVSICATSEAIKQSSSCFKKQIQMPLNNVSKKKSHNKKFIGDRSNSCSVDNGPLLTSDLNHNFTTPAIISHQTSASKVSSKIRTCQSSQKKQQQHYSSKKTTAAQQLAKRQEFEDLTKKQNSRLTEQKKSLNKAMAMAEPTSELQNQTVLHVASTSNQKQQRQLNKRKISYNHINHQSSIITSTKQPKQQTNSKDDRRLFQKTIEKIQSDQQIRNLKHELKLKKQIGSVNMANSTMSRNELAKVLNDATFASLNSSQKLQYNASKKHQSNRVMNTDTILTSPALVSQKIVLSGHQYEQQQQSHMDGDNFEHIEGEMPNTGKYIFDSSDKTEKVADEDDTAVNDDDEDDDNLDGEEIDDDTNIRMLEQTAVFSDSQDATAEQMHIDHMANQSPLKSGPSTVNGGSTSVYESPNKGGGNSPQVLSSSMKKIIVPPLNFEKVFEQQRLILEQEERRKREEEKKKMLLLQQKQKELAFQNSISSSKKKHLMKHSSSQSKKKHKMKNLLNSSASVKFEESPQSKLCDQSNIFTVQDCQSINDFETIVKVDKKTEEKLLMRNTMEEVVSGTTKKSSSSHGGKNQQRNKSKQNQSSDLGGIAVSETPKPMLAPPKAFQAPLRPPENQTNIKLQNINQKPMKFMLNKSRTTVQTPSKSFVDTNATAKHSKKSSITRQQPQQQQKNNMTNQKPIQSQQIISRNLHLATRNAVSISVPASNKSSIFAAPASNVTPKSRNYGKHVPSQHTQYNCDEQTIDITAGKGKSSSKKNACVKGITSEDKLKPSSVSKHQTTAEKQPNTKTRSHDSQNSRGSTSIFAKTVKKTNNEFTNQKTDTVQKQQIQNTAEKVQNNQLDSQQQQQTTVTEQNKTNSKSQKRSQSRVFIEEQLMQPILRQQATHHKVRPGSIISQIVHATSQADPIFVDYQHQPIRSCPFSPPGLSSSLASAAMAGSSNSRYSQAKSSNRVVSIPASQVGSKSIGAAARNRYRHNSIMQMPSGSNRKQQAMTSQQQITAFDNGDICDIDKQLSLNVKVPVQAPSILRKSINATGAAVGTTSTTSGSGLYIAKNNSQSSSSNGCFVATSGTMTTSSQQHQSNAATKIGAAAGGCTTTTSAAASLRSRQASGGRQKSMSTTSAADTYSSLFKKRSGILQRQATAISQVEQKGQRAWKI